MNSNVEEIFLYREILNESQGDYITLPFFVPDHTEEIEVEISYTDEEVNVIDLGIEEPAGFKGWSGGARKRIFLREDRSTPGYSLGALHPGQWGVILNAYKVPQKCNVTIKVSIHIRNDRWFKGDLHLHTNHSDGVFAVEEVIEKVRNAGLQFLALTDHNTFSQNYHYPIVEDIAIIPGVELTTNRGHCNFLGINKPFADFRCKTAEDVKEKITEGQNNGAIVSINHPHCQNCWWDWGLENFEVSVVEIWNGPWSDQNAETLKWWDDQLRAGKRIVAIGGSDTHREHDLIKYGTPTNWIYAGMHSPKELLSSLEQGRVCVASDRHGPWLQLKIESAIIGGVHHQNGKEILLEIETECKAGILKIISEKGTIYEETIQTVNKSNTFKVPSDSKYVRAEIWEADLKLPIVISNPIYISK